MTSTVNSVLIDTCAWIRIWEGSNTAKRFFYYILNNHYCLVVPECVINELCHKLKQTKKNMLTWIVQHKPKELQIFHDKDSTCTDASTLGAKYSFCHYPDTVLLGFCKLNTTILVTYDRNLLLSAQLEGVLACTPEDFRRYAT